MDRRSFWGSRDQAWEALLSSANLSRQLTPLQFNTELHAIASTFSVENPQRGREFAGYVASRLKQFYEKEKLGPIVLPTTSENHDACVKLPPPLVLTVAAEKAQNCLRWEQLPIDQLPSRWDWGQSDGCDYVVATNLAVGPLNADEVQPLLINKVRITGPKDCKFANFTAGAIDRLTPARAIIKTATSCNLSGETSPVEWIWVGVAKIIPMIVRDSMQKPDCGARRWLFNAFYDAKRASRSSYVQQHILSTLIDCFATGDPLRMKLESMVSSGNLDDVFTIFESIASDVVLGKSLPEEKSWEDFSEPPSGSSDVYDTQKVRASEASKHGSVIVRLFSAFEECIMDIVRQVCDTDRGHFAALCNHLEKSGAFEKPQTLPCTFPHFCDDKTDQHVLVLTKNVLDHLFLIAYRLRNICAHGSHREQWTSRVTFMDLERDAIPLPAAKDYAHFLSLLDTQGRRAATEGAVQACVSLCQILVNAVRILLVPTASSLTSTPIPTRETDNLEDDDMLP